MVVYLEIDTDNAGPINFKLSKTKWKQVYMSSIDENIF